VGAFGAADLARAEFELTMMHILVTGGTGFLGRHLVLALQAQGHAVHVLGRNEKACRELQEAGNEVVRADLSDAPAVRAACATMDAVIHVAALSAPWGRRDDFYRANVDGTAHIIAGCQAHKVARLIHVSSPSVVFDGRDHLLGTEAMPYPKRFMCHYAETKKLAEDLVQAANRQGLATTILRPKAIFGPGDTSLLPRLLNAARQGRLPQIGDGANCVDLTYVDNVVHALILALHAPAVGRIYTITNGEHVRLWDLIRDVLTRVGIDAKLRRLPYRFVYLLAMLMEARSKLLGGEPLLTRYTTAILARTQTYDISAARRDLAYEPIVSVAEGVERSLAELLKGGK
jgi:2-alkyl-3-oxoalkanoate reductase